MHRKGLLPLRYGEGFPCRQDKMGEANILRPLAYPREESA